MIRIAKRHPYLVTAFSLALAAMLFFTVRLAASMIFWNDRAHLDQPLAGWMTPRYITRSWNVPPDLVATTLALERDGAGRRVTLQDLADQQGRSLESLIEDLKVALSSHRTTANE